MTHDYESWWRVGTAQVSENQKVEEAARKIAREVESARKY
jgi:3D-(3,5/4)-trihydroxycyclohexane-1,2-dione acylhydrolase (decyclizing)